MADVFLRHLLHSLRRTIGAPEQAEFGDAELVRRFVVARDASAFETLVRRHAAMVLAICRRVLGHGVDAEDAFQATFLVLLSKGRSISKHQAVASWLYRVAYRTALRARRAASRRRRHELRVPHQPAAESAAEGLPADVRSILDREVARLPEKYRAAVVLCYLGGKTKEEAARLLACPPGTVSSRLARARRCLRNRLVREGVLLPAASVISLLTSQISQALPAEALMQSALEIGSGLAPGAGWQGAGASRASLTLTKAVLQQMLVARLATIGVVVLAIATVGGGSTALVVRAMQPADGSGALPPPVSVVTGSPSIKEQAPPEANQGRDTSPFPNASGYVWAVYPQEISNPKLTNHRDVLGLIEKDPDGSLTVEISHPPRYSEAGWPYYRPVAFDSSGGRCVLSFASGQLDKHRALNRYRLDPTQLRARAVSYLGVEELPFEGRKQSAAFAKGLAQERGIQTLPLAEVGRPFDFAITASDGRTINSGDWHGEVVVIHCWDRGHPLSMQQRDALRALYQCRHTEGLELIGINLNSQGRQTKSLGADVTAPWPEVVVPCDLTTRQLWVQASEILALPRMLVLDRRGILRADNPPHWPETIDRLLRES
jgi:RNA polymerase sigma factor (sigma-70 family)